MDQRGNSMGQAIEQGECLLQNEAATSLMLKVCSKGELNLTIH